MPGGAVQVDASRPSLDERFAIGLCSSCETTRTLVRDDDQARRQLDERDQAAKDRRLVARVRRGDVPKGPEGDAMGAKAELIRKRWAERLHPGAKEVR